MASPLDNLNAELKRGPSRIRPQDKKIDASQLATMGQFYEQAYTLLNSEGPKRRSHDGESEANKQLYGQGYILNYRRQPAAVEHAC